METPIRRWTLGELAALLDGELHGPWDLTITGPAPAGQGRADELSFGGDAKYLALIEQSDVGAALVPMGVAIAKPSIQVASPRAAFGKFLSLCVRPLPINAGIHPTAIVSPDARIDPSSQIGAYAVVEQGAVVGANARVYPFAYVGDSCRLGADTVLYPHVVLVQDVSLGDRVVVHAGTVLGADGFGYVWDGTRHVKVPQVGGVTIADDCEIGALTTIDRATSGQTSLDAGTKLDNLVMVAHNTAIGKSTVIASQTGIGGSSTIGSNVTFGGQVGIGDHATIGDGVIFAARAASPLGITGPPGIYKGYPARPLIREQRIQASLDRLPELVRRVKELERRLAELEEK